jgi:hypothetical protein
MIRTQAHDGHMNGYEPHSSCLVATHAMCVGTLSLHHLIASSPHHLIKSSHHYLITSSPYHFHIRSRLPACLLACLPCPGSIKIEGLWFFHQYAFNNGANFVAGVSTSILNGDPNASHVNVVQGQSVRIHDCW